MTDSQLLTPALAERLRNEPRRWLVTGAAGFIGSNLVEALLSAGQEVIGFDNYSTGYPANVEAAIGAFPDARFTMVEGDIRDREACGRVVEGVDAILHQAALGSVPRSIVDPLTSHDANVTGFINLLDSARQAGVPRFVYASSSSVYGDNPDLPKVEDVVGRPVSPYAATKWINEVYAGVYSKVYEYRATGLRYFNVFGPRQDPDGAYAAVIPRWVKAMLEDDDVIVNGDGETSRDFCYVANAVQANILAALAPDEVQGEAFNVSFGDRTSLNRLFAIVRDALGRHQVHYDKPPVHRDFRPGDVRHTLADTDKAKRLLGYQPSHSLAAGLELALPYYLERFGR